MESQQVASVTVHLHDLIGFPVEFHKIELLLDIICCYQRTRLQVIQPFGAPYEMAKTVKQQSRTIDLCFVSDQHVTEALKNTQERQKYRSQSRTSLGDDSKQVKASYFLGRCDAQRDLAKSNA